LLLRGKLLDLGKRLINAMRFSHNSTVLNASFFREETAHFPFLSRWRSLFIDHRR
jgi:hypothetical protein